MVNTVSALINPLWWIRRLWWHQPTLSLAVVDAYYTDLPPDCVPVLHHLFSLRCVLCGRWRARRVPLPCPTCAEGIRTRMAGTLL